MVLDLKIAPSGQTIVKPTALGPIANTDTKLLIYGLFQKGRVLAQDGELEAGLFPPPGSSGARPGLDYAHIHEELSLISRDAVLSAMRGWADHTVPDVQRHLRVHATSLLMAFADTGRPADTSIQTRRSNT